MSATTPLKIQSGETKQFQSGDFLSPTFGGTGLSTYNQGDILYANAPNSLTTLAGNNTTTLKVLTQVGDGVNPSTISWQPFPEAGEFVYFFIDTASSIATYKQMVNPVTGVEAYVTDAAPADGNIIQSFATNSGVPGITFIPAGIWRVHIHGYKTGGTKTTALYAEVYKRVLAGTETLLGTTGITTALTSVEADLGDVNVTIGDTVLLTTDRIVVKIRESITGAGSIPTSITIGYAGATSARLAFPAEAADITNFIPYTGATKNIDLGANSIVGGTWAATKIGLAYGGTNADLSATGGTSQVLKQVSAGGAITVAQLAASDLSNGTTGSGSVVLSSGPTLTTPTLGVASATSINFGSGALSSFTPTTSYTPTFSSSGTGATVGNGTITGNYHIIGNTVYVQVDFVWGTTTSAGTGQQKISLPVTAAKSSTGSVWALQSGVAYFIGTVILSTNSSNSYVWFSSNNVGAWWSASNPFAWTNLSELHFAITYLK